ncbi:MAG: VTT domain-containing protein [Candidatus Magasanikbacteria bacterium]|nr:VTT domain-containing protein [Candidatus Magasanikbacteria bacterium]
MLDQLIVYIQSLIATYGAWGVFLATMIEEIIAPIPSPIVPLAAGFFLITPEITSLAHVLVKILFVIAIPVTAGITIGSSGVYAIGFFGGKPVLDRTKKWLGFGWEDVQKVEARLRKGKKDEWVLFFLRMIPIIPGVAISGLFGIIRYPFYKFITITILGAFLRAFILGIIGWKVGEVYGAFAHTVEKSEDYILFVVLGIAVIWTIYYVVKKRTLKNKTIQS